MGFKYPIKIRAVWWEDNNVCWIDTSKLPFNEVIRCTNDPKRVAKAIIDMEIRGAPAIGVAAALAVAAYAVSLKGLSREEFVAKVDNAIEILWKTRPTAYNLFWALKRMRNILYRSIKGYEDIVEAIVKEAINIMNEDIEANIRLGDYGAELIEDGDTILTHCNAGALATAAFGTVGGIIRAAWYQGKKIRVITTETRPVLQGARLNVWEYTKEGIPITLITDNMAAFVIKKGLVDKVIVGADRITGDGYVANKIGTYAIALAAKRHNIPFYVAAPTSTIDLESTGDKIVIEERSPDEVRKVLGHLITLPDVPVYNFAFDITDPDLVTAIITEKGIVYPPYKENLRKIIGSEEK
ncbi:S-methyl-5-thioribose-1-phosphate isomerase [Desulfurococcaceae archaeon MEX13E-LK6-19]|nr:S-methyl-5-thioribose-1-phosphate isomerase [Desulfurococcaceae archaeon MEX13E-LK6-19]